MGSTLPSSLRPPAKATAGAADEAGTAARVGYNFLAGAAAGVLQQGFPSLGYTGLA